MNESPDLPADESVPTNYNAPPPSLSDFLLAGNTDVSSGFPPGRKPELTPVFLHGWQCAPGGVRPTYLAQHDHQVINPKRPDDDFEEASESPKLRSTSSSRRSSWDRVRCGWNRIGTAIRFQTRMLSGGK
jgi:hypothetical protein